MMVATLGHCIICFKLQQKVTSTLISTSSLSEAICQRFYTSISKYLHLDPGGFDFEPETCTKNSPSSVSTGMQVCKICAPVLSAFCTVFESWQRLELDVNSTLQNIVEMVATTDEDNKAGHSSDRNELKRKLKEAGKTIQDVDNFRSNFVKQVAQKRKSIFAQAKLTARNNKGHEHFVSVPRESSEAKLGRNVIWDEKLEENDSNLLSDREEGMSDNEADSLENYGCSINNSIGEARVVNGLGATLFMADPLTEEEGMMKGVDIETGTKEEANHTNLNTISGISQFYGEGRNQNQQSMLDNDNANAYHSEAQVDDGNSFKCNVCHQSFEFKQWVTLDSWEKVVRAYVLPLF